MNTFNILDRTQPIHRHHLLEASAGTGKTFSIENIVVRLLVEPDPNGAPPLTIDRILVVTFTRASARDLRTRIRSNIDRALSFLSKPSEAPDYVKAWIEQGDTFLSQAKRNLEQALFCFDFASIYTIHGFCSKMLRRYALEGEMGLDASGGEESLHTTEMLSVIRDFFRTEVTLELYSPAQLDIVLRNDPDQKELLKTLRKGCEITPYPSFADLLKQFQSKMHDLKKHFKLNAADLIDDFNQQAPSYRNHKSGVTKAETLEMIQKFAALFDKAEWSANDLDSLLKDGLVWVEALNPDLIKSKQKTQTLLYPHLTDNLQKELYPIIQEGRNFAILLARLTYDCKKVLDRYREEQEKLNPDDLLLKMAKSLEEKAFASKVRSNYQAAIIDEFQDTDPIQWQIFHDLFLFSDSVWAGYLYLVGDPKQSIYAFRQADIYTYLSAGNALGTEHIASLNTNFRSQSDLVHALNTLFSAENTPKWIPLPRLNTDLPYHPVQPSPFIADRNFDDGKENVHFFIGDSELNLEECEKQQLFPFIGKEILDLHHQHNLPYDHFAILVKDRYQADRLSEFLKKLNIPFVNQRSISIINSPAIPALIDLIQAVLHPRDLSMVKAALGSCLIGWNEKQMRQIDDSKSLEKVLSQIHVLRQQLIHEGFAQFFHSFLQYQWHEDHKTVLERLLEQEGGIDLYHNLQQIADVLTEEQQKNKTSAEGLIGLIDQLKVWDENDDNRVKTRQNLSKKGVNILTLHFSKGLEFGIVFALGLANRTSMKEDLFPIQKEGKRFLIAPTDKNDVDYQQYCAEIDAEKMRQLYVAMTRAKDRLYIPIAMQKKKKLHLGEASPLELFLARFQHPPLDNMSSDALYSRIREENCQNLLNFIDLQGEKNHLSYSHLNENALNKPTVHSEKEFIELIEPQNIFIPTKTLITTSFSTLTSHHHNHFEEDLTPPHDMDIFGKSIHTLPAGSETGILLHHILEKMPFHQFKDIQDISLAESWILPHVHKSPLKNWNKTITTLILNTLQTPLDHVDEGFCLAMLQPDQMYREMPFLFPYEGSTAIEEFESTPGFIKGVIDLIFVWKEKYYIVDWKSNWLGQQTEHYHPEKLKLAMHSNHYFLQAEIYTEAWKRYVKLVDPRPFNACFGGVFYLFLRGLDPSQPSQSGIYPVIDEK